MNSRWWVLTAPLLTLLLLTGAQAQPGGRGGMGGGGPEGDDPPPFTEVIKEYEQVDGLFDLYWNKETGQVLLALEPDQFGPNYLVSSTLNAGTGGGRYIAPMLWASVPVYFKQTYKTIQVIRPNTRMFADEDRAINRAVAQGRSDSILVSLKSMCAPATADEAKGKDAPKDDEKGDESKAGNKKHKTGKSKGQRAHGRTYAPAQNDVAIPGEGPAPADEDDDADEVDEGGSDAPDDEGDESEDADTEDDKKIEQTPPVEGTILIDATPLFMNGIVELGGRGGGPGAGAIDPQGSFFTNVQGFPENSNVEVTLNLAGGNDDFAFAFGAAGGSNPDSRSTILKLVYSMTQIPVDDYQPRLSDERVGYFLTLRHDFTENTGYTRTVRYINRWKLEKQDPTAELSEPVEPIVYWVDRNVPEEYQEAVAAGITGWQPAFEAAGFKNGIIAKQMPEDADWDPADARYNVIRWFIAPGSAFAIGPSRANPYTGQLYDADIGFSADMVSFSSRRYANVINPLHAITQQRLRASAMGTLLPPMVNQLQEANSDPLGWMTQQQELAAAASAAEAQGGQSDQCAYVDEMMDYAGTLYHAALMQGAFVPGSPEEHAFLTEYITAITLHEVGHTLGLRHNYKASTFHSPSALSTESAHDAGLTGSVMDYTGVNLAPRSGTQGHYFQTRVGPYDIHAIKYGYGSFPGGSSTEGERAALEDLAAQGTERGLAYATDDDAGGWSAAMDPTTQYWDLSDDPITYYTDQLAVGRELLTSIDWTLRGDQTPYPAYRRMFSYALGPWSQASTNVPRYIGGIVHVRHRVGDPGGELPFTPVPAAKQREALRFCIDNYFAKGAFSFQPDLLRKLAIERHADLDQTPSPSPRRDFPVHDSILGIQTAPLLWIYDPLVLHRMEDMPMMLPAGSDVLTIAELFGAVRGAIWQEAFDATNVDSIRRNLQREHLRHITSLYLQGGSWYPEDALTMARQDLVTLRSALDKALTSTTLDGISRAHYQESRDRIDETLNAVVTKGGLTINVGF